MRKFLWGTCITAAVLVVSVMGAGAAVVGDGDSGGRPLTADLSGDNEVPPADPDGSGASVVTLNQGQGQVCWETDWEDIAEPTAAHIHAGPAGENGPVVVPLSPEDAGCTEADRDLIKAIRQDPEQYYVNVHNDDFPAGAIRGQLTK